VEENGDLSLDFKEFEDPDPDEEEEEIASKKHTSEKKLDCPYGRCNYSFTSAEAKEIHIKKKHKGNNAIY